MLKIAHIINPVNVKEASDLFVAQPVTFETMRQARTYAENHVSVKQLVACYEEDAIIVTHGFDKTPSLKRSILDILKPFLIPLRTKSPG